DISARAHRDARIARQRIHRGRAFLRGVRLSASASSASVVRWLLDLLGLYLFDQGFTRCRLSCGDSCFAFNVLSRSAGAISRAFAMGISGDLSIDCRSLAYLGGTPFSGLFSVSDQL